MRYPKGSLQINPSRDLPLLRQVLRSVFVTHPQLFEFMKLNHYELTRESFDWRLRRLVGQGLIRRQVHPAWTGSFVYSIGPSAALLLQGAGEYCLVGWGRFNGKEADRSVHHAIGLNEIHLSLLRAGLLVRWTGALEVRSQNELTTFGFAKDYDAVVTVRTESGDLRFALEYERSPKPIRYYKEIAAFLNREAHVNRVLYLVCNYDLLQFISRFFKDARQRVVFGLESDWRRELLDMPVISTSSTERLRFREALVDMTRDQTAIGVSA